MFPDPESRRPLADRLAAALGPCVDVRYVPACPSTSSLLRGMAGASGGAMLVFTDLQQAGRGTRGRSWVQPSAPGLDIAMSYGRQAADPDPRLGLALGVALAEGLSAASDCAVRVKWPNDLVAGPEGRKLGGILLESTGGCVLAGLGINVNSKRADFPGQLQPQLTTLSEECGEPLDLEALLLAAAMALHSVLSAADITPWLQRWGDHESGSTARYRLDRGGVSIAVEAEAVDALRGVLIVRSADGQRHEVVSYTELSPG